MSSPSKPDRNMYGHVAQDKMDSNYSSRFSLASDQSYYSAEDSPYVPGNPYEDSANSIYYRYPQKSKDVPIMLTPIEEIRSDLPSMSRGVKFSDGIRTVDFVLVYRITKDANEMKRFSRRQVYESNLVDEGLELEQHYDDDTDLGFVKIHAPWEVLSRYADIMKLKMPMKEMSVTLAEVGITFRESNSHTAKDFSRFYPQALGQMVQKMSEFVHVKEGLWDEKKQFTTVFTRDKEYLFDIPEPKEDFFFPAQKSQIVDFILKRKRFSNKQTDIYAFGIKNLLNDEVYFAAYPLHEGRYDKFAEMNERRWLMENWASLRCVFKNQPLDEIRKYFGVKIGLYYAWLGFYTYMLIPASIVGVCCFLYGILTMYTDDSG